MPLKNYITHATTNLQLHKSD